MAVGDELQLLSLGGDTYRYFFNVGFSPGILNVEILAGKFEDGSFANAQATKSLLVVGPEANLVAPADGGAIGLGSLNNRGFIDVSFLVPAGKTIDPATVLDVGSDSKDTSADEFTLSVPAGSSVSLVHTQEPVLLDAATNTFRYWVTGTYDTVAGGQITVTFLPGSGWQADYARGASICVYRI